MTPVDILKKSRAYIERGWCQRSYAQTADGTPTLEEAHDAARWCMSGATLRVGFHDLSVPRFATEEARRLLMAAIPESMTTWNDAPERTQEEVLAAFDRAIALAEASS